MNWTLQNWVVIYPSRPSPPLRRSHPPESGIRRCKFLVLPGPPRLRYQAHHLTKVQNYEVRPEISFMLHENLGDRGGLVAMTRLLGRRVLRSKSDFNEDPPCICLFQVKSYIVAKRPPTSVVWKIGEGVPFHVSSSDFGSK
ncbi:hypothetical protein AVEN_16143-1 [Araneus ventricosus]|uniref:Uncharacterized protein n=1 Tax=Araneus ventricosus TaxID=182803 RepID=A0A4Y2W5K0_ARAVE|nr:hypothetical protein AVEN_16143-1 [Araneus ventricosus]